MAEEVEETPSPATVPAPTSIFILFFTFFFLYFYFLAKGIRNLWLTRKDYESNEEKLNRSGWALNGSFVSGKITLLIRKII